MRININQCMETEVAPNFIHSQQYIETCMWLAVKTSMKIGGLNAFLAVKLQKYLEIYICERFRITNYM